MFRRHSNRHACLGIAANPRWSLTDPEAAEAPDLHTPAFCQPGAESRENSGNSSFHILVSQEMEMRFDSRGKLRSIHGGRSRWYVPLASYRSRHNGAAPRGAAICKDSARIELLSRLTEFGQWTKPLAR